MNGVRVPLTVVDPADVALDPITVVLADDHALVRGGLRRILEAEDDLEVVAEAGDADEAIEIAARAPPADRAARRHDAGHARASTRSRACSAPRPAAPW